VCGPTNGDSYYHYKYVIVCGPTNGDSYYHYKYVIVCGFTYAYLANLSSSQGTFPSKFKHASVTPLLKKPGHDPTVSANFQPILNQNNISKIFKRLFLTRLQPYIDSSPSFNHLQSAYRKHHSTETSLIHFLDSIYHAADNELATLLFSLDLSAAFDTIDHTILLNRLTSISASWVPLTTGLSPISPTGLYQSLPAQLVHPQW